MKYRNLGDTGIQVSAVGFGLWTVSTGWWGIDDERHGLDLLRKAYDSGVTFFDTADTYGQGKGETMLADALGDVRDRIVVATKFGYDFYNQTNERDGHKELPQSSRASNACERTTSTYISCTTRACGRSRAMSFLPHSMN
jgi:aryl-alcohol dehydrogenase-like predicted oxidoreductase